MNWIRRIMNKLFIDNESFDIDDILKYYEEKQFFVKVINKEGYPGLVGSYLFISWKR